MLLFSLFSMLATGKLVAASVGQPAATSPGHDCVILLHGLARTRFSMSTMESALRDAGYATVNVGYPSRKETIEDLARHTIPRAIARCSAPGLHEIHFVTHSLGGILVRYYLQYFSVNTLGRTVMLSPPNQGSETVDRLKDSKLFRWFNGPAGLQLGTGADGLPSQLAPVSFPLGVITGNRAAIWDLPFTGDIPGEDDGKVGVESAKVEGMSDFLVVPYSHSFIMSSEAVVAQTLYFLKHGRFDRPSRVDRRDAVN